MLNRFLISQPMFRAVNGDVNEPKQRAYLKFESLWLPVSKYTLIYNKCLKRSENQLRQC